MSYVCRVCCGEREKNTYTAKEMMFGFGNEFSYVQCANCESLQICEILSQDEIKKFYPDTYYSFISTPDKTDSYKEKARRLARHHRDKSYFSFDISGYIFRLMKPNAFIETIAKTGISIESKILDVGCGNGKLLNHLRTIGFKNLIGVDPFAPCDFKTNAGVEIKRSYVSQLNETYDLIMYHHSFEHVPDPFIELKSVAERLNSGGACLIRIPTPSSEAWEKYGTKWVQLDAPRHFTLISRKGIELLAGRCGLSLRSLVDDGAGWVFSASELYLRGVPLVKQRVEMFFTVEQLSIFDSQARKANDIGRGDQIAVIFSKP
ncbi:Ubiquinone biosynthesis O-methyltransferase, mitochondrial [Pleomorphomonas sp. T1.2MG-36]|uniref:class I SAM-dependent methyltransferase n=1 Tax=Pleomorphomonas sp. T1.2MG-36 TaxID=3041167 RepID=UPI0024776F89|nr:class I SAM-dependent methyltransferase [Pleomorphomonas sp. T1.2MG-36]CAI9406734.1 Ubiquinone biosynthesis O-methyltransferase, mitochondrial [Pleomorphomonas sp. T1.2MG-36]